VLDRRSVDFGVPVPPLRPLVPQRILDFDTECRPMHYSEYRQESQITAIAWSWVGSEDVSCRVLEPSLRNERSMLRRFLEVLAQADIVTGHYIRKHDLPLIVDHCIRIGMPIPKPVLVSDTMDMPKVKALGKSQENLATLFGLEAEKHHMCGTSWRQANSLTPAGRAVTRKRVVDDVIQHKQLRADLVERGLLKPPTMWRP
jgi:DNA polymerase elongation subunit (family B)